MGESHEGLSCDGYPGFTGGRRGFEAGELVGLLGVRSLSCLAQIVAAIEVRVCQCVGGDQRMEDGRIPEFIDIEQTVAVEIAGLSNIAGFDAEEPGGVSAHRPSQKSADGIGAENDIRGADDIGDGVALAQDVVVPIGAGKGDLGSVVGAEPDSVDAQLLGEQPAASDEQESGEHTQQRNARLSGFSVRDAFHDDRIREPRHGLEGCGNPSASRRPGSKSADSDSQGPRRTGSPARGDRRRSGRRPPEARPGRWSGD